MVVALAVGCFHFIAHAEIEGQVAGDFPIVLDEAGVEKAAQRVGRGAADVAAGRDAQQE